MVLVGLLKKRGIDSAFLYVLFPTVEGAALCDAVEKAALPLLC